MKKETEVVILSAARTPVGNFGGNFKFLPAHVLGAIALRGALTRATLTPSEIQEVIFGCVLTAGQGQAPARQAAIGAGIPVCVPATTINKMCGSGMKALMLAHDEIKAGSFSLIAAGGMESMSQTPYLIPQARFGYRLGHGRLLDHLMCDGLEDAYEPGKSMGEFAELCADKYQFTRAELDEFATRSLQRAQHATKTGLVTAEIEPVTVVESAGEITISQDENPNKARAEKIPQLKPAFKKNGVITPASSSSISDGAAAILIANAEHAKALHKKPLAKIVAHDSYAQEPAWFTTAPITAIQGVLKKACWDIDEVDLFEINEAFAVVVLSAMRDLGISAEKMNVHGGACALGHPIGASGARIVVTLLYALQQRGLKKGIASLCIGGGEATAIAIEML